MASINYIANYLLGEAEYRHEVDIPQKVMILAIYHISGDVIFLSKVRPPLTLAKTPVCAESAYYATHPNNHIPYVTDSLCSSHASALRNVIIGNGQM